MHVKASRVISELVRAIGEASGDIEVAVVKEKKMVIKEMILEDYDEFGYQFNICVEDYNK